MTAKAIEPSQVIRLPMTALKEIFDENPDMLVRVVQVIMIRLQRVIFTALRNYLGLHSELVQTKSHKDKKPSEKQQPTQQTSSATSAAVATAAISVPLTKGSPTQNSFKRPADYTHTLSSESGDFSRPDMLNDLSEGSWPKHHRRVSSLALDRDFIDQPSLQTLAVEGFLKELGLKDTDRHLLDGNIEFQEAEPGITLLREGNPNDVCLLLILSGSVSVLQNTGKLQSEVCRHYDEINCFYDSHKFLFLLSGSYVQCIFGRITRRLIRFDRRKMPVHCPCSSSFKSGNFKSNSRVQFDARTTIDGCVCCEHCCTKVVATCASM